MTRPASRSSASRPETRSITEGVGLPVPSFFLRATKAKPEIFVPIGEYDQVLCVRECWLVTGSEKRTETMLDSRLSPVRPDRMDCPVLDVSRLPTRVDRFGLRPPNTTLNR